MGEMPISFRDYTRLEHVLVSNFADTAFTTGGLASGGLIPIWYSDLTEPT